MQWGKKFLLTIRRHLKISKGTALEKRNTTYVSIRDFIHFSKVRNLKNMPMSVTWHGWSPQLRFAWDESSRNEALPLWEISEWGGRDLLRSGLFPSLFWYKKFSPFQMRNKSCTLKILLFQTIVHQHGKTHLYNLEASKQLALILFTLMINITSIC